VTSAVFSSDDKPTAHTIPIASAVPNDASANRADSGRDCSFDLALPTCGVTRFG
jgi:hypothetical protein